jgi:LuxR family maltose regulon positive regulatory protein
MIDESNAVPLIRTKLRRPRVSDDLVLRPHLWDRLNQGVDRKLTLVSAPAGFGKTTLVASWLELCHRPSAWLSLDENDNDLFLFLSYLISAIRTLFPQACRDTLELLQSPQAPPSDYVTTSLINDIAELSEAFVLALDDFHHIHDDAIQQLMTRLIEAQPIQLHLVIASRTDPVLPLPGLRGGRQMTEIRAQDLRFSEEEALQFLRRAVGEDLDQATATGLQQRTEGWIVGLRLAALSMEGAADRAAILDGFAGDTNEFVLDYLIDEVLLRQPDTRQQFLLQTSILDRFNAGLCDAVFCGKADDINSDQLAGQAQVFLDELRSANLFLVPLDKEHGWYRYHHLFQEMLRPRALLTYGRDEICALHRRAAEWFAAQDYVEEAIRHALSGNDVEFAIGLVEDQSDNPLNRWDRATLERCLAMLPEGTVWRRPRLLLSRGWMLYRQWRMTALESVLDRAETVLGVDPDSPVSTEQQPINGQILALRSATNYLVQSDYGRALVSGKKALQQLPAGAGGARATAAIFRAFSQQALGQQGQAVRQLREAMEDPSPHAPAKVQIVLGLAMVHLVAGDLFQMQQTSDYLRMLAERTKSPNAIPGAHYVAGILHYEWNDLQAARGHFSKGFELRYQANFVASFHAAIGLTRIHQWQGDLEQAQGTINLLREHTLHLNNTDFLLLLDAAQAEQWLCQGETVSALSWARSFHREPLQDNIFNFELPVLTKVRILVAEGTMDEVQTMRSLLQMQATTLEANHFTNRTVQTLAHLALVELRLGLPDAAIGALQRALNLGQPGGFVRSIVDAGSSLVPLLQQLRERGVAPDYVSKLLTAFGPTRTASRATASRWRTESERPEELPEPLTLREEEILRLIGRGLTNQEIAAELIISPHTVKTHATHIYAKLAVKNRVRAVRKARHLGILPKQDTTS